MSDCQKLTETKGVFVVGGITVTYWVYEDEENLNPDMDPVILVHGGPGLPSMYMEPLKQLACRGQKVVRYDQESELFSLFTQYSQNNPEKIKKNVILDKNS